MPRPPCPCLRPATADSAQDLAAELVHYGFVHEVCRPGMARLGGGQKVGRALFPPCQPPTLQDDRAKLAAFLESTFLKYRGAQ